jgi:hypothetical protein
MTARDESPRSDCCAVRVQVIVEASRSRGRLRHTSARIAKAASGQV